MNKKLLIILISLLLVFIGLSVYVFFVRSGNTPATVNNVPPETLIVSENVADPDAPLVQITSGVVAGVGTTLEGHVIVVFGNGTLQVLDARGVVVEEARFGLEPIIDARVSPNGGGIAFEVLNTTSLTSRWYTWERGDAVAPTALPATVRDAYFSPQNTLLRVESEDDGLSSRLVLASGTSGSTLLTTRIPDLVARWIDESSLLLYSQPSGSAPGVVYRFNTRTRSLASVGGSRPGLVATGSGSDNPFLFTWATTPTRLRSSLIDGDDEDQLAIVVLPERCSSPEDGVLICSALNSQAGGKLMPDDYYKGVVTNTSSALVRIRLETGAVTPLYVVPFDASNIALSADGKYIFATDKNSGALWRVRLENSL